MTTGVFFCAGCNERFAVETGAPVCPQCGQTVTAWINAPTLEFSEVEVRGVIAGEEDESADALLGARLAHYDIESVLGQGGMGRVYRARHRTLERPCAIKILNNQLLRKNPAYVELFHSEARAAASLVHPHVVTIHNIGQDQGHHFIEMEYVEGRSLSSVLERLGRLEVTEATRLMVQIAAALELAHAQLLIHRDIKPANVLVTARGNAKLADFGLAKRVAARGEGGSSRQLSGTPYYMAPELFQGQVADPRSDVYAMGVTYFVLLTGQPPFRSPSLAELARLHESASLPDVRGWRSETPDAVVRILARCLDKAPDRRYADAAELHADLAATFGSLRSLDNLLEEALRESHAEVRQEGERFVVTVHLPEGRRQTVFVELVEDEVMAEPNVKLYSVCGPADPAYFERALELNATLAHGSIALTNLDGRSQFVMSNAYPKATCDPLELRQSILTIGRHADRIEQFLTGGDAH